MIVQITVRTVRPASESLSQLHKSDKVQNNLIIPRIEFGTQQLQYSQNEALCSVTYCVLHVSATPKERSHLTN